VITVTAASSRAAVPSIARPVHPGRWGAGIYGRAGEQRTVTLGPAPRPMHCSCSPRTYAVRAATGYTGPGDERVVVQGGNVGRIALTGLTPRGPGERETGAAQPLSSALRIL
jgi:hypothetical protein